MDNAENVIQETRDYDKFSFMDANRKQLRGHIEALKKSFIEVGNLTKAQPILVNEKFQIIDGQHRFTACKELELPIYYTVVSHLGISHARTINVLHKIWRIEDFARSYALSGNINYQKYLDLREDYGYNHTITLSYILNGQPKGCFRIFRKGEFVMPDNGDEQAKDRLDKLAEVSSLIPFKDEAFASAFLKVINVEGYKQQRMISKLTNANHLVRRMVTVPDNLRMLEEIYNWKSQEVGHLRLY